MEIIAEVIRDHYDLGEVAMPQQLEGAHQRRHRKMTVETSKGKFLVKTYNTDPVALDALRFQHHLSERLHENELPVARIQRARSGKGFVELDTWAVELQRFIEGKSMRVNGATLTSSANALGRLHEVCRDLPHPPRDVNMWRFSEVPREIFQNLFDRAKAESSDPVVDACCNELALFTREAQEALSIEKRNEFEVGLIHGDWHGANLLYRRDELAAIIDLEFAGHGCYLEDIAYGISNLCIRTTASGEKMLARTNILLDTYQMHRSLSYAELVALPYAVGVKHLTTVAYQTQQHGKVAGYTAVQWLKRLVLQCRWLAQQSHKARWGE